MVIVLSSLEIFKKFEIFLILSSSALKDCLTNFSLPVVPEVEIN